MSKPSIKHIKAAAIHAQRESLVDVLIYTRRTITVEEYAFQLGHDFAHERARVLEEQLETTSQCDNCGGCKKSARAALARYRGGDK